MMAVQGVWTVPRSGLIFTKVSETALALTVVMPFLPEMKEAHDNGADVPKTAEDLMAWQRDDYNCIAKRFRAAGVTVESRVEEIK